MDPILSIIIPSYNTFSYVEEVLPTYLLSNNYKEKIVCYLIDDGSKDGKTSDLLKKWSLKYPDLFKYVYKENGGHGSVINYGIYHCVKTKFFKVIDGDDWVDGGELEKLIDYLIKCDDDIVVNDFIYEYSDKKTLSVGKKQNSSLFPYKIHIHNVTYKTDLWLKNQIKVREHVFYEDSQYVMFPIEFVKTHSYFKCAPYHYRCDNINQSVNPVQQLKHKNDFEIVAIDNLNLVERLYLNSSDPDKMAFLKEMLFKILDGAFQLNSAYCLKLNVAIKNCISFQSNLPKNSLILKEYKKTSKYYKRISRLNFKFLFIYRLLHKLKKL